MQKIKDILIEIVQEVVSTNTVNDERNFDRPLQELGIDSLDAMLLFLKIQEKFNLKEIPESELKRLSTLNKIARYVAGTLNGGISSETVYKEETE